MAVWVWDDLTCEKCGKPLEKKNSVVLTFDQRTNTYTKEHVPPQYSQGGFRFGKDCARKLLKEDKEKRKSVILDQTENEDQI